MDCIWTSQKAGITINYVAACDFENQSAIDSILKIVLSQINRQVTSLKILVLVNHRWLSFPNGHFQNFFSIGFDTLREIDNDYIFDYYWNQQSISASENHGLNKFRSQEFPIDINSTNNKKALKTVGVKIIYDIEYSLGKPVWDDLIKAIVYATKNSDVLKSQQRRDTVRYNTNGWYVTLTTIDTFAINKIIGRQSETKKKDTALESPKLKNNYWVIGLLGFIVVGVILYLARQYSR
ncbi:MAG: hypothetical protein ABL872_10270 [Lacibacter sp.]